MIGHISRGSGFGGLVRYLVHGDREEEPDPERVLWTAVRNMPTENPELSAAIMRATSEMNERGVEKPVWHLSLSWHPEDDPSREQMQEAAERVLEKLGISEHQAVLVAHGDTAHAHVHVVVNRVHPETLRVWKGWQDMVKVERVLRVLEKERGLVATPGHHGRLPGQKAPDRSQGRTRGEEQQSRREGEQPWSERMREALRPHFREAQSWGELSQRIAEHGVRLQKKGRGLVVTDGSREVKASRIDRGGSIHKLEARFGMSFKDWHSRVEAVREAVASYERMEEKRDELQLDQVRAGQQLEEVRELGRPLEKLAHERRATLGQLQRQLTIIYGAGGEKERLDGLVRLAELHGYRRVADELRHKPKTFGKLAGRVSLMGEPDPKRRVILQTVQSAASTLQELGGHHRAIARYLDREMREQWEQAGRPLEAPDSATQARWRQEKAGERIDRLLPRIYREEAVEGLSERFKRSQDPEELAQQLRERPEALGPVLGKSLGRWESQERKEALEVVPRLAVAVQEHSEARSQSISLALKAGREQLERAEQHFKAAHDALHQLPSMSKLLAPVARAAERVGREALGQVLPVPGEIAYLEKAAQGLGSLAAVAGRSRDPRDEASAEAMALKAAEVGLKVLKHLLPPQQAAAVRLAQRVTSELTRVLGRGMSR